MSNSGIVKPLIKYTGGKYDEYKFFKDEIPNIINNYYEPFFGGGGVFFQLHNEGRINGVSYINDISKDLMDFYRNVINSKFIENIQEISDVWDEIREIGEKIFDIYGQSFFEVILGKKNIDTFINDGLYDVLMWLYKNTKYLSTFNTHGFSFPNYAFEEILSKTKRFKKKIINPKDIDIPYKSLTTAVHQSFYFIIRSMYNQWLTEKQKEYTSEEKSAHWFFIREFCYGSMFRFSKNGRFNIPYGGFSYNKKCFSCKVEDVKDKKIQELFKNIKISNDDFSIALKRDFKENDFIFLDPPYDSTFCDYDNNPFGMEEQIRLKNTLDRIHCKWLMVIRETNFIVNLYNNYKQIKFNKTYSYQARGTYNGKNSIHLIIKNF